MQKVKREMIIDNMLINAAQHNGFKDFHFNKIQEQQMMNKEH